MRRLLLAAVLLPMLVAPACAADFVSDFLQARWAINAILPLNCKLRIIMLKGCTFMDCELMGAEVENCASFI